MTSPYDETLRLAADRVRASDPEAICRTTGARRTPGGLELQYFDGTVEVTLPEIRIRPDGISLYERILILHYLDAPGGPSSSGEYVQFKNLPGASFYEPAYRRRGPARLMSRFESAPEQLLTAGAAIGGTAESFGDVSVRLQIFPKIEAVVVLYIGDDELPGEAAVLYRNDIAGYLPLEDIAVVGGLIASRLGRALEAAKNGP